MDFVVVGLGLGGLAILSGVVLLGVIARRWERTAARAATADDARYDSAQAAARRGAGQALLSAGGAILLATVGAIAGALDDRTGAFLVTTTATVAALGLLVREYLARLRHPLPRRPRPVHMTEPLAVATSAGQAPAEPDVVREATATRDGDLDAAVAFAGEAPASAEIEHAPLATAPEEAASRPAGERAPYSFMADDAAPAEPRTEPYSFMLADAENDDDAVPSSDSSVDGPPERDEAIPAAHSAEPESPPEDEVPTGVDEGRESREG